MSASSRQERDDALKTTYEEFEARFANQAYGASAGTSERPQPSGPFRGQVLPTVAIGPVPSTTVHVGYGDRAQKGKW